MIIVGRQPINTFNMYDENNQQLRILRNLKYILQIELK